MNKEDVDYYAKAATLMSTISPLTEFITVFTEHGDPVPKSRPRFTKNGGTYSSPKQRVAEQALGYRMKEEVPEPLRGNLVLACWFFRSTRRTVDVDNLMKLVLDAGNTIAWNDDSQVTAQFGALELDRDNPRTIIAVARHKTTMIRD